MLYVALLLATLRRALRAHRDLLPAVRTCDRRSEGDHEDVALTAEQVDHCYDSLP